MAMKSRGRHEAPKRRISKSKTVDSIYKRNKLKLDMFFSMLVIFVVSASYLGSMAILDARNQEYAYLQKSITEFETFNERLKLEIGYIDTLDMVETKAVQEMSMIEASSEQLIFLTSNTSIEHDQDAEVVPELSEINVSSSANIPLFSSAQQSINDILLRWNF